MRVCKRTAVLLLLLLWCLSVAASAAVTTDYVLDDGEKRPIPRPYVPVRTLSVTASTGRSLNAPQDLFLAPSGDLVVADTGNNRVLVLSPSGEVKREITEAGGLPLSKPQGVFVDELGHLFIADSSNARIVHLSPDGTFIEAFGKPETGYLTSIDLYTPTKVLFSASTGYLYTIMGKELLTLNANNEFKGYFAANQLGFSLKNRLIQMFATEEQKKRLRKPEPVSFQNIHYQDGRIYAVSAGGKDNVRVINSIGNNIFPSGSYGEREIDADTGLPVEPILADIAVDARQTVTVAQENNSRIYQYDMDGNLLAVFGGKGKTAGYFDLIASIAMDGEGRLYVLDAGQQNIQVLEPTRFTSRLHEASQLYASGDYAQALDVLHEVRALAPSYPLVREKIGDILYKQKDYAAAMTEYRLAGAQEKYGKAFEKERYLFSQQYFLLTVLGIAAALVAVVLLARLGVKLAARAETALYFGSPGRLKTALLLFPLTLVHPVRAFERIKHVRRRLGVLPAFVLVGAVCLLRVAQIAWTNYTVADTTLQQTSLALEMGVIVVPVLAFSLLCYLVTSLQLGECTCKELLLDVSYSLAPAIVVLPVLTLVSRAVGAAEAVFYHMAVELLVVWIVLLVCVAVSRSNQYGFWKTVLVLLLTLVAIALTAALLMLFVSLSAHVITSVGEMLKELEALGG